jgi:hypothetical protein
VDLAEPSLTGIEQGITDIGFFSMEDSKKCIRIEDWSRIALHALGELMRTSSFSS